MRISQDTMSIIVFVGIVIGFVQCFFGYRIFKLILFLTGFVVGALVAGIVGQTISHSGGTALLTGLVGGIIGGFLFVFLSFLGIFCIGAGCGLLLGAVLFAISGNNPQPAALLIMAVIGGVLALIFHKFMIILATAFGGSFNVVYGISYFTVGAITLNNVEYFFRQAGAQAWAMLLCWTLLGIIGMIVQYRGLLASPKSAATTSTPTKPPTQPRPES